MSYKEGAISVFAVLMVIAILEVYMAWKDGRCRKQEEDKEIKRKEAVSKLKPFHFNPSQDEWY